MFSRLLGKLAHGKLNEIFTANGLFSKINLPFGITQHDIFDAQQHGNLVKKYIDEPKLNMGILLGLIKASDTVDHDMLLSKLSALDISWKTHSWFTAYLKNSDQFCYVDG